MKTSTIRTLTFLSTFVLTAGCDNGDLGDNSTSAGESDSNGDDADSCPEDACGPAPGAPDELCDDGVTWVGFECAETNEGCGWQRESCPTPCSAEECGPAPGAPQLPCPDGVNMSGPSCVRDTDGTCGYIELECPACCDPSSVPACDGSATCCGDGTWVCGDASSCPDDATALPCADSEEEPVCNDEGEACVPGADSCCAGLQCCSGVPVPEGEEFCGEICPMSDRNKKENFEAVDVNAVLDKVSALDISTWNYTFQDPKFRHLGPMAQDFRATFQIGHTDKAIFQVDADGVALASIQALHQQLRALRSENDGLHSTVASLERRLEALESGQGDGPARRTKKSSPK